MARCTRERVTSGRQYGGLPAQAVGSRDSETDLAERRDVTVSVCQFQRCPVDEDFSKHLHRFINGWFAGPSARSGGNANEVTLFGEGLNLGFSQGFSSPSLDTVSF